MDDDDGLDYDQDRGDDEIDESLCNGYHDDIIRRVCGAAKSVK